jgi:hypothetical protein
VHASTCSSPGKRVEDYPFSSGTRRQQKCKNGRLYHFALNNTSSETGHLLYSRIGDIRHCLPTTTSRPPENSLNFRPRETLFDPFDQLRCPDFFLFSYKLMNLQGKCLATGVDAECGREVVQSSLIRRQDRDKASRLLDHLFRILDPSNHFHP